MDNLIGYMIHILTSTTPDDKTTKDAVEKVFNYFSKQGCKTRELIDLANIII